MEINPITPPSYQVLGMHLSIGLAAVIREPDGVFLDFYGQDATTAIRVAIPAANARKMLAELQQLVDLLAHPVPPGTSIDSN